MDPITAFAMAQAAIAGVRKCVDLYKEAKSVAADVSDITIEVGSHLGKFFEAQDHVKKAAEEDKKKPRKGKSVSATALDNVLRLRHLQEAETELREFMIYQTPGLGGLWSEFEAERARLEKERKLQEADEKKNFAANERKRRREREKLHIRIAIAASIILVSFVIVALMYGVHLNYQEKKRLRIENTEFHKKYETDPETIECWKEYKMTGFLPQDCIAKERKKRWTGSNK
jgi:hypothetical protein